jgi:hypothetical protein
MTYYLSFSSFNKEHIRFIESLQASEAGRWGSPSLLQSLNKTLVEHQQWQYKTEQP